MTTWRYSPGTVNAMSDNKNRSGRRPRMAALAVMAGVIVLASGCGGSSSNPDASSSATANVAKEVAYANCMRAHGVDVSVGSNGISENGSGDGKGEGGSAAQASAENACRHLLPNGGQPSQSQIAAHQAQALKQDLKYSECMRSHGVPDFPDPSKGPNGMIGFNHVDAGVPAYAKANQACQSLLAGGGS